jgi:hypothetical protein
VGMWPPSVGLPMTKPALLLMARLTSSRGTTSRFRVFTPTPATYYNYCYLQGRNPKPEAIGKTCSHMCEAYSGLQPIYLYQQRSTVQHSWQSIDSPQSHAVSSENLRAVLAHVHMVG